MIINLLRKAHVKISVLPTHRDDETAVMKKLRHCHPLYNFEKRRLVKQ